MAITFVNETNTFYLENENLTYAFRIVKGYLNHLYYGKKIGHDDLEYSYSYGANPLQVVAANGLQYETYAPELSFFGFGDYREPTVQVINENGDRLAELLYVGHDIVETKPRINGMPSLDGGQTLIVHLKDSVSGFGADLYYTVYDDCDVIARRIVYINGGESTVRLERAYSFTFALPENDYDVISLHGAWAAERVVQHTNTHFGTVAIDSKRNSSSNTINPFMAICDKNTTEEQGNAYGVSLVYSSSFKIVADGAPEGNVVISGGINDFDFSWKLEAGESFETPEAVIAFSASGLGGMSRAFHDAYRNHLINKKYVFAERPIIINNWEGTTFYFDEQKLKAIIDGVEGTGINTFVLDDGWFGVRNDIHSGLGDWFVNTEKLPCGIKGIADYTHSKGMKFGLWFEPEMISEDSDLFRAHPDFAIKAENRQACKGREQYVLDITRKDVRDHIIDVVNGVIRDNSIDYVKWDSNRFVTEFVSSQLPSDRQREFSHRYALGLYDMLDRIVLANPDVLFEGCSAGGARFDPAMLYYFPQIWTSDNTDVDSRTRIQYGTSMVYPLSAMSCHVTSATCRGRNINIKTRGDISSLGAFGYELDASTFTDEDRQQAREIIDEYKEWNADLVLHGDLYRIKSPFDTNFFAESVVSKDKNKAILVVFRSKFYMNYAPPHFKMSGLDENKRYYVRELDKTYSGSTLMNLGFVLYNHIGGDYTSQKYHFEAVE